MATSAPTTFGCVTHANRVGNTFRPSSVEVTLTLAVGDGDDAGLGVTFGVVSVLACGSLPPSLAEQADALPRAAQRPKLIHREGPITSEKKLIAQAFACLALDQKGAPGCR